MKKLLGIVVLGLLWCNVGVADIIEIERKKITREKFGIYGTQIISYEVKTVCIDGYKFVIAEAHTGISITQAFYRGGGKTVLPEKC